MSGQSDQLPTEQFRSGLSIHWGKLLVTFVGLVYTAVSVGFSRYIEASAAAVVWVIGSTVGIVTGWIGIVLARFGAVAAVAWDAALSFVTLLGPFAVVAAVTAVLAYYAGWKVIENA